MKKPFAIGRVQSVASPGELLVRPSFRWDGTPGRRQSHKNDTMGVGSAPNCPDRSRCGTSGSSTRNGGDTGRHFVSHPCSAKIFNLEEKGKRLEKITWAKSLSRGCAQQRIVGPTANARDFAPRPLRSARHEPYPKKNLTEFERPS